MDFEIMIFIFNLVDNVLPVRCQYIPVLSLETLRDVRKGGIELRCCRDITGLRDRRRSAKVS